MRAVILAGGKGERFWPLSTSRRPKQLLSLVGDQPLITQAARHYRGELKSLSDRTQVQTPAE